LEAEEEFDFSDYDHKNYDDLSDAPQEELSEAEQDKFMWETFRDKHKGRRPSCY